MKGSIRERLKKIKIVEGDIEINIDNLSDFEIEEKYRWMINFEDSFNKVLHSKGKEFIKVERIK